MSTDSYVGSPLFFAGENIGDLAPNGTVSNMYKGKILSNGIIH